MILRVITILFFIFGGALNSVIVVSQRPSPFGASQNFFLQDLMPENWLNPTSTFQENRTFINNVFDPNLSSDKDIAFELYTRDNPTEAFLLKTGDIEKLRASPFSSERPTKIIVHGWTDSANTFWLHNFRRNYLHAGDYNVICIDWFFGSSKEYVVATKLTRQVGECLAEFLEFLANQTGMSLDNVHILGHSLGAHIAGYAGVGTSGRIGRITGMDPAGPGFETPIFKDPKDRLDSTDAKFVDVIHTCAGTLGISRPIGHADFYPNGGSFRQPGCSVLSTQYCSHGRSHVYMAESIIRPEAFIGLQCNSWIDFKAGKCKDNSTTALMGEKIDRGTRGTFYLETNSESPFGKGEV